MPDATEALYQFATSLEGLKKLIRYRGQYYWKDYPNPPQYESVADHSWRLAMLVISLKDQLAKPIDLEKALQMALIHDLPEILAGDESPLGTDGTGKGTHAYDATVAAQRHEHEAVAAEQLFDVMPNGQGQRLFNLWQEYERNECFEAQVVRALDKIEALLQVLEYRQGHMFPAHLEFATNYWRKYQDVDPAIRAFGERLVEKMQQMYRPFVAL